jgi:hypothetical protein
MMNLWQANTISEYEAIVHLSQFCIDILEG